MKPVILIRADAGLHIGSGHVMRTLTLADMLGDAGFAVRYATKKSADNLDALIRSRGYEVISLRSESGKESLRDTAAAALDANAVMMIIDHYGITEEDETWLKSVTDLPIFCIDDLFSRHECDLLLNQNLYATNASYAGRVPSRCRLFTGASYALIRKEFREMPKRKRERLEKETIRLLVTLGGSDEANVALKVMEGVASSRYPFETTVVCGAMNPHAATLEAFSKGCGKPFTILKSTDRMAALMQESDLAVTAGGSTTLELLYMKIPFAVISVAQNQEKIVETLEARGLALSLGGYESLEISEIRRALERLVDDEALRCDMAGRMEKLFETDRAGEMIRAIKQAVYAGASLESATMEDENPLLSLANDACVRQNSFSSGEIDPATHRSWLLKLLADKSRRLFCIRLKGTFLGQIRFDHLNQKDQTLISISLSDEIRGLSLAETFIRRAVIKMVKEEGVRRIEAKILGHNTPSIRSFERAGFSVVGRGDYIVMEYLA